MGAIKKGLAFAETITPKVVLSDVSKAHLFDMLLDRARAELGEDATDYQCLRLMGRWSEPVAVVRGDKPIDAERSLASAVRVARRSGFQRYVNAYTSEHEKYLRTDLP